MVYECLCMYMNVYVCIWKYKVCIWKWRTLHKVQHTFTCMEMMIYECLCMYMNVYVCIWMYMNEDESEEHYIRFYIHTHVCKWWYMNVYVCIWMNMYVYIYVFYFFE